VDEGPSGWAVPLYETVLDRAALSRGGSLLDLGCGGGELARMAVDRGARVTGIDSDPGQLERARALVPEATFEVGDIQALPVLDGPFAAVTLVQSLMHVANPLRALRAAARVAAPGAPVLATVWGEESQCDLRAFGAALSGLLGPAARPRRDAPGVQPPPLSQDGRLTRLVELAGLGVTETGEVVCPFVYPDEDDLLDDLLASGLGRRALRVASVPEVRNAVLSGLAPFRLRGGAYRLDNTFRYLVARTPA
jgi:SAM-dependent methyltransferase